MAHSQKCRFGSEDEPNLRQSLSDAIRLLGRTVRNVYGADNWRRRDVVSGKMHAAPVLEQFIRRAHAAGAPIEDVLPIPAAIERFICDLYGSQPNTIEAAIGDAWRAETEATGRADVAQIMALSTGGVGPLAEAEQALYVQRVATDRAWRAVSVAVQRVQAGQLSTQALRLVR